MHRLINKMFVIDVPEMKLGGVLEDFTFTCTAAVVAAFISFVKELGTNTNRYVSLKSYVSL